MKKTKWIALMLTIVLASGISAFAETAGDSGAEKVMEAASKAIDEGNLEPFH